MPPHVRLYLSQSGKRGRGTFAKFPAATTVQLELGRLLARMQPRRHFPPAMHAAKMRSQNGRSIDIFKPHCQMPGARVVPEASLAAPKIKWPTPRRK